VKKILLISDTHGFLDPALEKFIDGCDEVWHAGDIGTAALADQLSAKKPLRAVFGNIDGADLRIQFPEIINFTCEGLKVCITHIGGYPGKYPAKIKSLLKEQKPGLFICGHSHILKVMYDKDLSLLHINPGACGVHGFHHVKTAVRFTIDKGEIKDLSVIELGRRTT
jgi:putative phosphoesterase